MAISENAKNYHEKMFPGYDSDFKRTDPEFIELFDSFAFDEVVNHDDIDDRTRFMTILANLIGCQGKEEYQAMVPAALNFGVKPIEIKEIVYQAVAYLGIGRVFPFLKITNKVFEKRGIKLPLENQATTGTDEQDRLKDGEQAQIAIFGPRMKDFAKSGPAASQHINKWLVDNCFGDYYTRKGLTLKERELMTFCYLSAQGGVEPQLIAHAKANLSMGNDKQFLINVISQNIPYIGYPRSLNALRCVNTAASELEKK